MRSKILLIIIIIIILGISFLAYRALGNNTPRIGKLRIEASTQCSVFLDNQLLGRTTYEDDLKEGEYTLKLIPESQLDSLSTWQGKIQIFPSRLTFIKVDLAQSELLTAVDMLWLEKTSNKDAEVVVIANPEGSTVLLDDVSKGSSPVTISNVNPGDHTLQISSSGFISRTLKIHTTAGYKVNASVKLSLLPTGGVSSEQPLKTAVTSIPEASIAGVVNSPMVIIKDTPTGFLRVRFEPSTSSSESGRVKPNDKFPILGEQSGWYKIEYTPGSVGWISGTYAQKI